MKQLNTLRIHVLNKLNKHASSLHITSIIELLKSLTHNSVLKSNA